MTTVNALTEVALALIVIVATAMLWTQRPTVKKTLVASYGVIPTYLHRAPAIGYNGRHRAVA